MYHSEICFNSALGWNRTNDPLLKRQVLYRLSYERVFGWFLPLAFPKTNSTIQNNGQ